MVKTLLLIAASAWLTMNSAYADGMEPAMQKTKLPAIKTLVISENGARSPASGDASARCERFVLRKHEVAAYLRNASEVAHHDYLHMLDWSPCYASGSVVFENGLSGVWGIQQLRAGSLTLSDGRTVYLYCPECRAKAFAPVR